MEYAMQCRAMFGLMLVSTVVIGSASAANGPGVTHVIENGEPVVIVRLVPAEDKVAPGPRIDALETPVSDGAGPSAGDPSAEPIDPAAMGGPGEDAVNPPDPEANASGAVNLPLAGGPALDSARGQAATATPPVARYPSVRPRPKPNDETGVGGELNLLTPPEEATPEQPKPMRLNSVDRPRKSAAREPRRERNVRRKSQAVVQAPAPRIPDPLDAAATPIILEKLPVDAIGLPLRKDGARLAEGN